MGDERISGAPQIVHTGTTYEGAKHEAKTSKATTTQRFHPAALGKKISDFIRKRAIDRNTLFGKITSDKKTSEARSARIAELEQKVSRDLNTAQFKYQVTEIISVFGKDAAVPYLEKKLGIWVDHQSTANVDTARIAKVVNEATSQNQSESMLILAKAKDFLGSAISDLKKSEDIRTS